jgi:hypothetical protein
LAIKRLSTAYVAGVSDGGDPYWPIGSVIDPFRSVRIVAQYFAALSYVWQQ